MIRLEKQTHIDNCLLYRKLEHGQTLVWMFEPIIHNYLASQHPPTPVPLYEMYQKPTSSGTTNDIFTTGELPTRRAKYRSLRTREIIIHSDNAPNLKNVRWISESNTLFDGVLIDENPRNNTSILWVFQISCATRHGRSARGVQMLKELKRSLKPVPAEMRYVLLSIDDKPSLAEWTMPDGWETGPVYCAYIPISTSSSVAKIIRKRKASQLY
ncbi:hypothetical protein E1B28_003430 [Marasmius oreades]|uniref:Uncharacterized protein n=1 Tax=Marasmius oreades TaxID=181124 RepID=A0A9P7RMH9_9AGAR|nr:uncharacterized protein E1B28_003430 [Marasmius oreades]KAG7085896.1 hypothetical protein E1B28_003430 [Marasmius oreades]